MATPSTTLPMNNTILTSPEDWDRWFDKLRAFVHPELWPHIDPSSNEPEILQEKPVRPTAQVVNPAAGSIANLTATQLKLYEILSREYESQQREFERQSSRLLDTRRHIISTVSPAKQILLNPAETIHEWLKALQAGTKPSQSHMTAHWKKEYRTRMKTKISRSKTTQWLDEWETVMANAIKYNLSDIDNGQWLKDLAMVIKPHSETLHMHLTLQAVNEENARASQYLSKSKEIREVLDSTLDMPLRTARGSTFSTNFVEGTTAAASPTRHETHQGAGGSRKRAGTKTGRSDQSAKRSNYKCTACEGVHPLSECWYVFSGKAPQGLSLSAYKQKKVQEKIDGSERLRAEISALSQDEA